MTDRIAKIIKIAERYEMMKKLDNKQIRRTKAAEILNISRRHIDRVYDLYRSEGFQGLESKQKGGNRAFAPLLKPKVLEIIKSEYPDFNCVHISEKLELVHKIKINRETIRQWLNEAGLRDSKKRKKPKIHQSRERRPCVGELVQIDGSYHDWFEGRGPNCCLIVFVDDATSRIMKMLFVPTETTLGYFDVIKKYIQSFGIPMAFYSDKYSVFRVNKKNVTSEASCETQFQRACKTLRIETIFANSSQAKGRVERVHQTLQDRLIKEMRLRGISDIDSANVFLEEFIIEYNKKFAKPPASRENAHKTFYFSTEVLNQILSIQNKRKLSKNLELSYNNTIYQIQSNEPGYTLRHANVLVCERQNKDIQIIYKDKALPYKTICKNRSPSPSADSKEINAYLDQVIVNNRANEEALMQL